MDFIYVYSVCELIMLFLSYWIKHQHWDKKVSLSWFALFIRTAISGRNLNISATSLQVMHWSIFTFNLQHICVLMETILPPSATVQLHPILPAQILPCQIHLQILLHVGKKNIKCSGISLDLEPFHSWFKWHKVLGIYDMYVDCLNMPQLLKDALLFETLMSS